MASIVPDESDRGTAHYQLAELNSNDERQKCLDPFTRTTKPGIGSDLTSLLYYVPTMLHPIDIFLRWSHRYYQIYTISF